MKKIQKEIAAVKTLPESPGVYLFKNSRGTVVYIGKAKNLRSRVTSYFAPNLLEKTSAMVAEATSISYILVGSEIEALLLEAKLVRQKMPHYNIALKDDKSPLYIGITREKYPRVLAFRKTQLPDAKLRDVFGPFTNGYAVKHILRFTRRIIPYSNHLPSDKICIYSQLGLCNPCPSEIENEKNPITKLKLRKKYLDNIKKVRRLLRGELSSVRKSLEKDVSKYSKSQMYEEAGDAQKRLKTLDYIVAHQSPPDIYLKDPNLMEDIRQIELDELKAMLQPFFDIPELRRIECFDIAHLAGTYPTASMVTFIDGEPDKEFYRHFKMYNTKRRSDVDSMMEVISRRIRHFEDWGRPDLIIVDGGKPQVSAVIEMISPHNIPVVGLAKRFETIVVKKENKFIEVRAKGHALNLLQRIRDEAHRFARKLHHKHVKRSLIGK